MGRLQNRLRGWFPKEHATVTYQKPVKFPPMIRWTARAVVVGSVVSAALLVLGYVAGFTHSVGAYLWHATVGSTVWGVVAAVPFLVKRKTTFQRRLQS
jgi:hypothetical protein